MAFFKKERKEYSPAGDKRKSFSGGNDRGVKRTLTNAICDSCGKSCKVPFKPTPGKSVYCSDCFREKDSSGQRGERVSAPRHSHDSDTRNHDSANKSSASSNRELAQINSKLDRILELLER